MFADRYFGARYFGDAYFGDGGDIEAIVEEEGGHSGWPERKGKKRRNDELKEQVNRFVDEAIAEEVPAVAEVATDEPPPITKRSKSYLLMPGSRRP